MPQEVSRDTWPPSELRIAGWDVRPSTLRIRKDAQTVRLEPKVMNLLLCLAARPGETVTRQELEVAVWPDVIVGYDALASAVNKLRTAFDDHAKPPQVIETIPKLGYRLIAPVEVPGEIAPESHTETPIRPRPGALRTVAAIAAGVVVVALIAVAWQLFRQGPAPSGGVERRTAGPQSPVGAEPGKPSIAVLAFENLTGDPDQEVWSDGISENIITELSRFADFFVIARHSTFSYKNRSADVREIGRALGARYVLEGSFRRDGEMVRITAQLVDAATGKHLWAERYEREREALFAVQDEITRTLVASLAGRLDRLELERAIARQTESLEAYELHQRGRRIWFEWTRDANERARRLYEEAIALDPDYAGAHRSLAWVHINAHRYDWGESRAKSLELAYQEAETALALASFDHRVHWTLASVHMRAGDLNRAIAGYKRALALNPNAADVFAHMSIALTYQGKFEEALAALDQAMALNPLYPYWYAWNLAWTYYMAGRYEDAVAAFGKMSHVPDRARVTLAAAYAQLGRLDEAKSEIDKFLASAPAYRLADEEELMRAAPFQDPALRQRWLDDVRRAGLPE